jgi:hypothetical protein
MLTVISWEHTVPSWKKHCRLHFPPYFNELLIKYYYNLLWCTFMNNLSCKTIFRHETLFITNWETTEMYCPMLSNLLYFIFRPNVRTFRPHVTHNMEIVVRSCRFSTVVAILNCLRPWLLFVIKRQSVLYNSHYIWSHSCLHIDHKLWKRVLVVTICWP